MVWNEEDGFFPDYEILINFNGEYFKVYSHESPIHGLSFKTIEDLLDYLREDLQKFQSDYRFYHGENKLIEESGKISELDHEIAKKFAKLRCSIIEAIKNYIKEIEKDKNVNQKKIKEKRDEDNLFKGNAIELNKRLKKLDKRIITDAKNAISENDKIIELIVLGDGGIGKTTYLLRHFFEKFHPSTPWRSVDLFIKNISVNNQEIPLFIWDLMGQERGRLLAKVFVNGINGAILMFDLTRSSTLENIKELVDLCRSENSDFPIIFIGTKLDNEEHIEVDEDYGKMFQEEFKFIDYIEISSKTGENVQESLDKIIEKIKRTSTLKETNNSLIHKKLRLLEYLRNYEVQDEELELYLKENYTNDINKIDFPITRLLLFSEFRDKIHKFIERL